MPLFRIHNRGALIQFGLSGWTNQFQAWSKRMANKMQIILNRSIQITKNTLHQLQIPANRALQNRSASIKFIAFKALMRNLIRYSCHHCYLSDYCLSSSDKFIFYSPSNALVRHHRRSFLAQPPSFIKRAHFFHFQEAKISSSLNAFTNLAGLSPLSKALKWASPQAILAFSRSRRSSTNRLLLVSTTK